MKNTKAYNEMFEKISSYESACAEYDKNKLEIIESYGYGSEELRKFHDTHTKPDYPLTGGQSKALRLVHWSETEELFFDDFVWESEAHDFIESLRAFGVKTFVLTNKGTALMENMHWFASEGCTLVGLCDYKRTNHWGETETVMGVRFDIQ